jgi:hypothetical protein
MGEVSLRGKKRVGVKGDIRKLFHGAIFFFGDLRAA